MFLEPAPAEEKPRLPRALCAAMAVQFAAGGAVIPFVTLCLRDRGLDIAHISLVFSASSATLLVFPCLWGLLADRFVPLNRLFTVINLLAGAALAAFLVQHHFLGWLLGYTLFYACLNPTFTLINALSFHHLANPRAQFGKLRAWGSLGWIMPFLPISLWVAQGRPSDLDAAVILGVALCFAMALLSFWLPHTPPGARQHPSGQHRAGTYLPAVRILLRDPNYLVVLLSFFLMIGSYSLLLYYSPLFLENLGVPRVWIGPIQAIGVIFEVVLFQWQSTLLRHWNYTTIILAGGVALLVRHLLYGFLDNVWLLSASYVLAGAVIVCYSIGVSLLVNHIARPQVRATAQTLLVLIGSGLGPMFANWAAGRLAAQAGNSLRPVFLFAAGLAGLASLLLASRGRQLEAAANPRVER